MYKKVDDADNLRTLLENCSDLFIALGDTVRRSLVINMLEVGYKGMNVSDLTARTHLSRPAVSHHLKVLKVCGIIKARRAGRSNFYYINAQEMLDRIRAFVTKAESLMITDAAFGKQ